MRPSWILGMSGSKRRRSWAGQMPRFALIGALGTIANIAIMTMLISCGLGYIIAALIAAETTIVSNFWMQERFVFTDRDSHRRQMPTRFLHSFAFNNAETMMRMPFLWLLVDKAGLQSLVAQSGTLAVAFLLRYAFHSRVVYAAAIGTTDLQHVVAPAPESTSEETF